MAKFWRQYLSNPKEVGFPVTCSKETASRMADAADIESARSVVEFGPGTGAVTQQILKRIPKDCKFFAIEINAELAKETELRTGAKVYVDSCANVLKYMGENEMESCDAIVCTIPWALLGEEETAHILDEVMKALVPGSRFVTVGLSMGRNMAGGKRLREELQRRFSTVEESKKIRANFPPAFYYLCIK